MLYPVELRGHVQHLSAVDVNFKALTGSSHGNLFDPLNSAGWRFGLPYPVFETVFSG